MIGILTADKRSFMRGEKPRLKHVSAAFIYITAIFIAVMLAAALLSISASAMMALDDMESMDGWSGTCSLETRNVYQGKKALRIDSIDAGDGKYLCLAYKQMSPVDISEYADGYIRFYLYVKDENNLGAESQFELTSSGTCDVEELTCSINTLDLRNGWNELIYSIAELSHSVHLDRINYIRLYMFQTGEQTLILDDIRIGHASDFGIGSVAVKERTVSTLDLCESTSGFTLGSGNKPSVYTEIKVEGRGAVGTQTDSNFVLIKQLDEPLDISDFIKSGYMYLWLYVENTDALKGSASLALRSSGKDMTAWKIKTLSTGWNELLLKFSDTSMGSGAINYAQINEIVLTVDNSAGNLFAVDKILYGYSRDFGIRSDDDPPLQMVQTDTPKEVTSANANVYKASLVISVCVIICAVLPLALNAYKFKGAANKKEQDSIV